MKETRRPRDMRYRLLPLPLLLLVLAACGEAGTSRPGTGGDRATTTSPSDGGQELDGLTLVLELDRSTVVSGEEVGSTLTVSNHSGETVTDPGCQLSQTSSAIIPVDDPDAELWQNVIVDCGGPFEMEDGFEDTWTGPDFAARTAQGDPLEPGTYTAATEILGYSQRLELPIEVTDAESSSDQECDVLCVSEDEVRPGETVRVTFRPPPRHIWGLSSELMRIQGGRVDLIAWTSGAPDESELTTVWPGPNVGFNDIGFYGQAEWDWEIPARLEPGVYELRKDAISDEEGTIEERTLEATDRFEVTG